MTDLAKRHVALGARLAPDGIPLDYGDLKSEYEAAQRGAILLDRSHEGRILLRGPDRFELVNRMSTNDISGLARREGKPTIFTNANARILFRANCYNLAQGLLLISEAGQGPALANYLRRNIFFRDEVDLSDISAATAHFALHGAGADRALQKFAPDSREIPPLGCAEAASEHGDLIIARRKSIYGDHWIVIGKREAAPALHRSLLESGERHGLVPAGSLTYNSLRIRSGRPAGLELSRDYIPLEVGLWDEVSFTKGCYTGQEIIARMESRRRLAKTLVKVALASLVAAPASVSAAGRTVGKLTSSVQAADGAVHALAVLRLESARPGQALRAGSAAIPARVLDYAGAQPPFVLDVSGAG